MKVRLKLEELQSFIIHWRDKACSVHFIIKMNEWVSNHLDELVEVE